MIIWLNGAHGAGKSTTAPLVRALVPGSRVFDPEKVGEVLMDISPPLSATENFQDWPMWRPLVVETARRVLDYAGGALIVPMTVLAEAYWREIAEGFASHGISVYHFLLHVDSTALRERIADDVRMGPSAFRMRHVGVYEHESARWLRSDAAVIDTTNQPPANAAAEIVAQLRNRRGTRFPETIQTDGR